MRRLAKVNKEGRAENMNHALLLLLLTPPAHETAIYRQREKGESKKIAAKKTSSETNSVTPRVDSRKSSERLRKRTRGKKGKQ